MLLPIVVLLLLTSVAAAADRPIPADRLVLRDASHVDGPKLRFLAGDVAALSLGMVDDPRVAGGTLEIVGNGSGDGATGRIPLAPHLWTALGSPSAPTGYEYADPGRGGGIRRIVISMGASAGSLLVVGGTAQLAYRITQAQSAIDVRLTLGDDVYCARLSSFAANGAGRVAAANAPAPPLCAPRTVRCGNHVVEAGEGCDDGNPAAGDGCSPACILTGPGGLCAGTGVAFGDGIATQLVSAGLDTPTHLTAPPLDTRRLFVSEQEGRIRIIKDGVLLPRPFLDIEDDVLCCGERGLFSVAFHPDYASNRRFFVAYTDNRGRLVIARYRASADPDVANPAGRRIVLRIAHPRGNHNGGQLAFGPDGYLYAGPGDGGGAADPDENAQDPASLLGKLLRIDVDVDAAPYRAVPSDNPFSAAGPRLGLIWAVGLRNPWRFAFDRLTGDLYVADVGQGQIEEIDFQPASSNGGENYGWDVFEGSSCFEPTPPATFCPARSSFVFPVLEYGHDQGCSVTGGMVYRGCAMPDLHGTYFYSDFCSPFVRTFRGVSGGVAQNRRDRTGDLAPGGGRALNNVVSFGEDARGELYIVDRDGEIYRIVSRAGPP